MVNYLGGANIAGGKMKSTGDLTTGNGFWTSPNDGATNESGFKGHPGGWRSGGDGLFANIGNFGRWWSSTESSETYAWRRGLRYNLPTIENSGSHYKSGGYSVRCVEGSGATVSLPTVTTSAVNAITQTTATSGGNVTNDGGATVTARGICRSTSPSPTIANSKTSNGTGTGTFTSNITGLTAGTTYYVRAYATNNVNTAYGNEVSFTTSAILPTVSTTAATNITETSATSGGSITDDGGATVTARGVCYSTSQNPTTADNPTSDGTGTGTFASSITGLIPSNTCYVRAYATNSVGTAYGNQVSFTTTAVGAEDVFNPTTGKIWMDKNLGALQVATSSTDANAYGDLYQWGRAADGHQSRTSGTTTTLSSSDTPGHSNFILAPNTPYDWRSPQNDNLWQGVNGTNNPCPSGYRLPTRAEWKAERQSWSSNDATGAFASPLKLPIAGRRERDDGTLVAVGSWGAYWSSSITTTNLYYLFFTSIDANVGGLYRAYGFSVRCIKD